MQNRVYIRVKRIIDVLFSAVVLIVILSWLTPLVVIIIFLESGDKPFFTQVRVGKKGVLFKIYKFRSMTGKPPVNDPLLSKDEQTRITKFGKFIRKYRVDEFPQFFNVLKGEMSIVGPRPERQYFLDEISKFVPEYVKMLQLKPGITSMGQIKFGYADTIQQMIKRAKYDLIYLEAISLFTDIKIILKTIIVVFKGKGK